MVVLLLFQSSRPRTAMLTFPLDRCGLLIILKPSGWEPAEEERKRQTDFIFLVNHQQLKTFHPSRAVWPKTNWTTTKQKHKVSAVSSSLKGTVWQGLLNSRACWWSLYTLATKTVLNKWGDCPEKQWHCINKTKQSWRELGKSRKEVRRWGNLEGRRTTAPLLSSLIQPAM